MGWKIEKKLTVAEEKLINSKLIETAPRWTTVSVIVVLFLILDSLSM